MREDTPINNVKQDRLGRCNMARSIATSIKARVEKNDSTPLCIGIYGKWGEGKTSFMNLIKEYLLNDTDKKINIIDFNPWNCIDSDSLWDEFFNCFSKAFNSKTKEKIIDYGRWFSKPISIAARLAVTRLSKDNNLGKDVQDSLDALLSGHPKPQAKSLIERKDEISKAFRKYNVVFIDDLDRLDSDEIRNVFRLVRQIADFKKTIYVIGMDDTVVSASLDKFYADKHGLSFIDKIVNVPVRLPVISLSVLKTQLQGNISTILESEDICIPATEFDKLTSLVSPLLGTMREIIRFSNQLDFDLPVVKNEVNCIDFIMLEAIKMSSPESYHIISSNKPLITRDLHINLIDMDKRREMISGRLKELNRSIVEAAQLDKRGPLTLIIDELIGTRAELVSEDYEKKLRSKNYFDRFFTFKVDSNASEFEINEIRNNLSDPQIVKILLAAVDRLYGEEELNRVARHILHAKQYGKDRAECGRYLAMALYPRRQELLTGLTGIKRSILVSKVILEDILHNNYEVFEDTATILFKDSDLSFAIECFALIFNSVEIRLLIKIFYPIKERLKDSPEYFYTADSDGILSITTIWSNDNKDELVMFIKNSMERNCTRMLKKINDKSVHFLSTIESQIGEDLMREMIGDAINEAKEDSGQKQFIMDLVMNTQAGKYFRDYSSSE